MKGGKNHVHDLHIQNMELIHDGLNSEQEIDLMKLRESIKHLK